MTEMEEEGLSSVDLDHRVSPAPEPSVQLSSPETQGEAHPPPAVQTENDPGVPPSTGPKVNRWITALDHFKMRRFFVLRPGTLNQAIEDIKSLVNQEEDGNVNGVWLMAEVDHWNNEKERLVLLTDHCLLICKYDFMMLNCEQIQRVPLNFIDRISHGGFSFPKQSLLLREGEGVRVFWDRLREPSFTSKWNPFATDLPFVTFTYHPVRNTNDTFAALCEILDFRQQLKEASEKAHALKPVPGKANGILVLNQPLQIDAYVGLMSSIGNQNKLGYSLARGNVGF